MPEVLNAESESRWCRGSRARWARMVWLGLAVAVFALGWQTIVGWPLNRRVSITFRQPESGADGLFEGRLSTKREVSPRNAPLARVWVDGHQLVRFASLDRLAKAQAEGCFVKDRAVYVRLGANGSLRPGEVFARVSWEPPLSLIAGLCLGFFALTVLLAKGSPPVLALVRVWYCSRWVPPLVLGAALAAGVALRFGGLDFPVWDPDTDDYLHAAAAIAGGQPLPVTDRPLGYPFIVGSLLRLFSDLRAVVVAAHLSGLAAAVVLGGILWACTRRLFPPGAWRIPGLLSAAGAVGLWTLHEGILRREWQILPEASAPAFIGLQLWLLWRMTTKSLPVWRLAGQYALFCAAGWMVFYIKSNWGFALGLLPLPWVAVCLSRFPRRRFLRWSALGAAICLGVCFLGLLGQSLTPANTEASVAIRSRVLVCWHVPIVRDEIARRLAAQTPPPHADVLQELAAILDEEIALTRREGPGAYPVLGFNGDRLYYFGFLKAPLFWSLPVAERSALCRDLFFTAMRRDPRPYLRKVVRQMGVLFRNPYGPTGLRLPHFPAMLAASEAFTQRPHPYLPEPVLQRYRATLAKVRPVLTGPWPTSARLALNVRVSAVYEVARAAFPWSLAIPMLTLVSAAAWPRWRRAVPWRRLAPVLCAALWATASALASALTSSVAQALEIHRYIDLFLVLLIFSEILWPLLAASLIRMLWRGFRRDN